MFTLGSALEDVRNSHQAFDATRTPDVVLRNYWRNYQTELIGKIVGRDKTKLAIRQEIPMPATVDVTVALPDLPKLLYIVGGEIVRQGDTTGVVERDPLGISTLARRPFQGRTVTLIGDQLFLNGSNTDWLPEVQAIDVYYVALPDPMEKRQSNFALPDDAKPCVIAYGCKIAAQRAVGYSEKVDPAYWAAEAQRCEDQYLKTLRWSQRPRITTMRDGNDDGDC